MDDFTPYERFLASTPPGHEWVPFVLIAFFLLAALAMRRRE
jgi:hypothetical protein